MKYLNSIVLAIFLTACTDYVQQMDEDFEEWELAQELANSSSSSQKVKSSSSLKSSSSETSSSSAKSSSSAGSSSSAEAPVSSNVDKVSSSSVVKPAESSSSSVVYVEPCNVNGVDKCEYGTLVDSRDGKKYKTVTIGTQIWMAQNLSYDDSYSWCYGGSAANCDKYGRMYTWAMAMDSVGRFSDNSKGCGYLAGSLPGYAICNAEFPVRGICPEGWHIPTKDEFKILIKTVGGGETPSVLQAKGYWAGAKDSYGFSAIPIKGSTSSKSASIGNLAVIWGSSIDASDERSESMGINETGIFVYPDDSGPDHGNAIRCVSDKSVMPKLSSSSSVKSNGSSSSSENAASIDVNDPPLVRDTMFSIDENLANGSSVGKIIAFDPDTIIAYCTLIYAIIESDVPFILDSNIIKVKNSSRLDYEVDSVFTFHVRVSDGMFGDTALVVVKLKDENEMLSSSSSGKASWAYLNPAISYGEMTDDRDGQIYKTVVIGEQTWMAENLRYGKKVSNGSEIKDDAIVAYFCYDGDTIKCMKYGGLYSWSEMMALPYNCNNINCSDLIDGDGIHQGICPQDWHVPSLTEWDALFTTVGGQSVAGKALKSSENWINNGDGLNTFGFSAIPAGYVSADGGKYFSEMSEAAFWTANIYSSYQAFYISLGHSTNGSYLTTYRGNVIGQSVRCIKNGSQMSNSSSSVSSSSSKASWVYLNPAISYGEITDDRDGQVYKTVEIGEQTWMAENLNYEIEPYKQNYEVVQSFCYNDSAKYCEKYGRLYTWDAAKRACPTDWRLPTNDEFEELFSAVGGQSIAGKMLRAFGDNSCCVGTNDYGFSGLPAGMWSDYDNQYVGEGSETNFWSSVKYDDSRAYYMMLWDASKYAYLDDPSDLNRLDFYKNHGKSVRCIKK